MSKNRRGGRREGVKSIMSDGYLSERKIKALEKRVAYWTRQFESRAKPLRRLRAEMSSDYPRLKREDMGWAIIWSEQSREAKTRLMEAQEALLVAQREWMRRFAVREVVQKASP